MNSDTQVDLKAVNVDLKPKDVDSGAVKIIVDTTNTSNSSFVVANIVAGILTKAFIALKVKADIKVEDFHVH